MSREEGKKEIRQQAKEDTNPVDLKKLSFEN